MYCIGNRVHNATADFANSLVIPNPFMDYVNNWTTTETTNTGREAFCFHGDLYYSQEDFYCETCRRNMERHDKYHVCLRHTCFGDKLTFVMVDKHRFVCNSCGASKMQTIPFQAEHHRITTELLAHSELLLSMGYTNKEVSGLTGLNQHTVKDIDKARLQRLYTEDGTTLKKPAHQAAHLAIDEFKLHDGYKFATHIIDLDRGHVLWIKEGKKKQVVYDFIEERCPDIQIVYDHFHIIKNFNEKVVSEIRKDEQRRLIEEGDEEAAKSLKGSRYILMSKRSTLARKDEEAKEGKILQQACPLFGVPEVKRSEGYQSRYRDLIDQNQLLFTVDLVKEMLEDAYKQTVDTDMANKIDQIIETCRATKNRHFQWFAKLLEDHYEGVIAHASLQITSGKIEGINNKIKVVRRQAYGFPDDEYFFLKIIDASRRTYVRNPKAPKVLH